MMRLNNEIVGRENRSITFLSKKSKNAKSKNLICAWNFRAIKELTFLIFGAKKAFN